jgi:hypothetical protein
MKSANNESCEDELKFLEDSCYADDLDFDILKRHLHLVCDVIKEASPTVCRVTSDRTVCDTMNINCAYKSLLSEVHKHLRLYLTIPITCSTSERTFSAMKRLLTYLRSTMTEKRLVKQLPVAAYPQRFNRQA